MKKMIKRKWVAFAAFFSMLVIVNIVAGFFYTRIDFTAEKRYTLSNISKEILHHIPEDVKVEVYLEGNLPSGLKHLRSETAAMLSDLRTISGGHLQVSFIDPLDGSQETNQKNIETLTAKGAVPTNLTVKTNAGVSQQLIFPSAIVSYGEEEIAVNLLEDRIGLAPEEALNHSVQNLEYNFMSAISKVTANGKPLVGFTEGHGELSDLELADGMKYLKQGYITGRVDLKKISSLDLQRLAVLVIAKPLLSFTESEKYKLNSYVRNGGSILWAIDQLNADLDSLSTRGEQLTIARQLNLDDILFKYGVRLNYDLIEDLNCARIPITIGNGQISLLPWAFYPIIMPLSPHPIVRNMEGILSNFMGSIDTVAAPGIKKEILLSSSPFNKTITAPAVISLQMIDQLTDMESFQRQPVPVAVILEGIFPDVFKNRPIPTGIEEPYNGNSASTKMLVIADGDVFKNQISSKDRSPFPLGYDQYSQHQYGNKSFLLNAVDYLANDSKLIELRQKEIKLRLMDKVKVANDHSFWQFVNVVLPLLLLALAGILQYFYRKHTYGNKRTS